MTARPPQVRFIELEGGLNFRDMGGYPAADERTVRWGVLYRSGTTFGMTPADTSQIASFGIRYAYDLRSNGERRRHPNVLQQIELVEYKYTDHDKLPGDLGRAVRDPDISVVKARDMMLHLYRQLPHTFRDAYRSLLLHLAHGDVPLVFNCTAGKDRTGVAAALILTALGVPREQVVADYLLTTRCFERSYEIIFSSESGTGLGDVQRDVWDVVLRADADYLNAMFEHLETHYGSVMRYLEHELGINHATLQTLQGNLLETV